MRPQRATETSTPRCRLPLCLPAQRAQFYRLDRQWSDSARRACCPAVASRVFFSPQPPSPPISPHLVGGMATAPADAIPLSAARREVAFPNEALPLLLPLLPLDARAAAACVSRPWRAAAAHPSLWKHLSFEGCAAQINDTTLTQLCARAGAALRTLDLSARRLELQIASRLRLDLQLQRRQHWQLARDVLLIPQAQLHVAADELSVLLRHGRRSRQVGVQRHAQRLEANEVPAWLARPAQLVQHHLGAVRHLRAPQIC